jgi:solute carrier family 13 (sodium-dependent dicarboxylate transporter), member 2/3/5
MTDTAVFQMATTSGPGLVRRPVAFPSWTFAAVLAVGSSWSLWTLPDDLGAEARMSLIVTVLTMIGWTLTRLPESLVALSAALALVLTGTVGEDRLYAALGSDLVWLLLAAFIIAAVIKESGLAERMVAPLTARRPRFAAFALALAIAIALTALILPSTSGRAALLLPVFLAMIPLLPDARLARALALVFPTVILLSAGGSLIGAGAHLIAVEAMVAAGAPRLGYLDWLLLGGPLATLASVAGVALILWLFVPRALWSLRMTAAAPAGPRTAQQSRILLVIATLVALWLGEAWHGLGMSLVAMLGALVLMTRPFTRRKTKDLFRAVDVELILYMTATMLLAQAVTDTGADRWLASQAMSTLPAGLLASGPGVAIALSVIAVVAHLAIASRSARAAILIPAVALPMAGLGHDATLMILIAVMGTGFCQTLMSSAKPVAIFGLREEAGFTRADLLRLALPLGVAKTCLLVAFALFVWPQQTATPRAPSDGSAPAVALTSDMLSALSAVPDLAPVRTPADPGMVIAQSPRPPTRPDGPGTQAATADKGEPVRKTVKKTAAKTTLGTQFARDLKQARRQIARDLNRLFN